MKPEESARQVIDNLLEQAGWAIQDRERFNLAARRGVAIREFSMSTGAADYLLFIDGDAVGTVEAKKVGETLIGVEEQSANII
jgi:type I restriction enzyme, R subunit